MAMIPSGSYGGSRTGSPFVIERDDESSFDNDLIDGDDGMYRLVLVGF